MSTVKFLGYKDIICENPTREIWKFLRFFKDSDYCSNIMRTNLGLGTSHFKAALKKQTLTIGYCIRQAEEYFLASANVTLATRPLLIYYGIICLSEALVLLRENIRRKGTAQNHHGLFLKPIGTFSDTQSFFESLNCEFNLVAEIPYGQFDRFYKSLSPQQLQIPIKIIKKGSTSVIDSSQITPGVDLRPLESIINEKIKPFELLKYLPDMYHLFRDMKIETNLSRGNLNIIYNHQYGENEQLQKIKETHNFYVDDITSPKKEKFIKFYAEMNPAIKLIDNFTKNLRLSLEREYTFNQAQPMIYYPDIIEDIHNQKFYVIDPEAHIMELAAFYILSFCLGTLCRYYPDIWIKAIDSNVQITEICDSLLNILVRKFPNLILDQMTQYKHHFHS